MSGQPSGSSPLLIVSPQYHIYLFERILLCCKDINPNKQKAKLTISKDKPAAPIKGKPRLQLKGRIYMANVTDILCSQKPGKFSPFIGSPSGWMMDELT